MIVILEALFRSIHNKNAIKYINLIYGIKKIGLIYTEVN